MTDVERLPPSTAAYVFAAALLAGVTGYFVGQGSSLRLFSSEGEGWPNNYDVKVHKDSSDEEDDEEDDEEEEEEEEDSDEEENELAAFDGNTDEVKLVLVIRTDLGMTKGMCFHSPASAFLSSFIWLNTGVQ